MADSAAYVGRQVRVSSAWADADPAAGRDEFELS